MYVCVCVVLFLSTAILCNDAWALQVGCCLMVFNEVKVWDGWVLSCSFYIERYNRILFEYLDAEAFDSQNFNIYLHYN